MVLWFISMIFTFVAKCFRWQRDWCSTRPHSEFRQHQDHIQVRALSLLNTCHLEWFRTLFLFIIVILTGSFHLQHIASGDNVFLCFVLVFTSGPPGGASSWWYWMRRMPWPRMPRMHCDEVNHLLGPGVACCVLHGPLSSQTLWLSLNKNTSAYAT